MADQSKRSSQVDNGEIVPSSKKSRVCAIPLAMVKQEQPGGGPTREAGHGVGAGVVVAMEVMEQPQLSNLKMDMALFHCQACLLPLKPPTFKCEAGHMVCGPCRDRHGQACGTAAAYAACAEVDAFLRAAKLPCAFREHGCASDVVYYQSSDHERACRWAPCYCPDPSCDAFTSPARLLEHFRAAHPSWPVTELPYGRATRLTLPPPPPQGQGLHVLVGEADRCVFLVSSSALGPAILASVVCLRANCDAAAGAAQYGCKLWVQDPRIGGSGAMTLLTFPVPSSSLPGGFAAVEQGLFLAVPPAMAHRASGEEPDLTIRIDKTGGAAAISTPAPTARSSGTAGCRPQQRRGPSQQSEFI